MGHEHIFNGIPSMIWESRSYTNGNFGEDPPISIRKGRSPKAFVIMRKCFFCSKIQLSAFEAYYSDQNGLIYWDNIGNRLSDGSVEGFTPVIGANLYSYRRRNIDLTDDTKIKLEELLFEIFNLEGFLSESQAKVLSKYKMNKPLRSSTLRNTKQQFQKKLRKMEAFVEYWDDLKDLIK